MWIAIAVGDNELHVIPLNDLIEHTENEDCVCVPKVEDLGDGQWMYTHSSLDGRELNEPDWKP